MPIVANRIIKGVAFLDGLYQVPPVDECILPILNRGCLLYTSAGARFIVVYTGAIMTMPGLPKVPAAERIDVDENGVLDGLF